jgi:hypothetical protein
MDIHSCTHIHTYIHSGCLHLDAQEREKKKETKKENKEAESWYGGICFCAQRAKKEMIDIKKTKANTQTALQVAKRAKGKSS